RRPTLFPAPPRPTATRVPIDTSPTIAPWQRVNTSRSRPCCQSMKTPQPPAEYREAERARRLADMVPNAEMRRQLLEVARGYEELPRARRQLPQTENGKATVACGLAKGGPRFGRICCSKSSASPSGSRGHIEQLRGERRAWLNRGGLA